jgi:7,8-dihydropterin-6-yl-methyl-4-(beta-D-ribofuranosyl)aminobenzene 5'-phosphate synthase
MTTAAMEASRPIEPEQRAGLDGRRKRSPGWKWLPPFLVAVLTHAGAQLEAQPADSQRAREVRLTVLSTMLADARGIGEWGFAALLEVDGRRLLIDTGARPETVLRNAEEWNIDLSGVTDVVLTHNHRDHVGGLLTLRRELARKNAASLTRAHVATGIFQSRVDGEGREANGLLPIREPYLAAGGRFLDHSGPTQVQPGVWFTGPVPRRHGERNYSPSWRLRTPAGLVEDTIPEDASIVVDTDAGLVVITGCGHAGIVNISEHARSFRAGAPVHAVLGGLHLLAASDEHLAWTGAKLKEFGLRHLMGAHCTGIEAVYRLRQACGLARQTAVVGAVGATFTLGSGIDALQLAR